MTSGDLIDALAARKGGLGLSNAFVEAALHMGENNLDKLLGPSRTKNLTVIVAHDLAELMGCRLVLQPDPALEAKMRERWEQRDSRKVHPPRRVSQAVMERARPIFFQQLSRLGNEARKAKLPREARASIARAAARCRWRLHRAAVKARATAGASP